MFKYLALLLDFYTISKKNRYHSLSSLYQNNDSLVSINDQKEFYRTPQIPMIQFQSENVNSNYEVGNFQYESEIKGNLENNDKVKGLYYRNTRSNNHVVIIHGWRSSSWKHLTDLFLPSFLQDNLNLYFIELPHHFNRTSKTALYSGEHFISANIDRTLLSVKQAVSDIRALIRYLNQNNGKVFLIGISLGGFLSNLVSTVEEKITGLVSIFYANSIATSVWKQRPCKFIKKDFLHNNCDFKEIQDCWAITQPSNFQPLIAKEKILLMSARYDLFINHTDSDLLWEAWGKPQRIKLKCSHSGLVMYKEILAKECLAFIKNALK